MLVALLAASLLIADSHGAFGQNSAPGQPAPSPPSDTSDNQAPDNQAPDTSDTVDSPGPDTFESTTAGAAPPLPPDRVVPEYPPELARVEATSPAHVDAARHYHHTARTLAETIDLRRTARQTLEGKRGQLADARGAYSDAVARRARAEALESEITEGIDQLLSARYVAASTPPDLEGLVTGEATAATGSRLLASIATDELLTRRHDERRVARAARRSGIEASSAAARLESDIAELTERHADAAAEITRLTTQLSQDQAEFTETRKAGVIADSDLTLLALAAYYHAAENAPGPTDWRLLAAIGWIESRHGTYPNTSLDETGRSLDLIIGIPLNGDRDTQVIEDSDGGRLDGDRRFDRAVGPMQFIPGTWSFSAVDGNGDTVEDPHNLWDAAASAAGYLCRNGGGESALVNYNRSEAYGVAVRGRRDAYRAIRTPAFDPNSSPQPAEPAVLPVVPDLTDYAWTPEALAASEPTETEPGETPTGETPPTEAGPEPARDVVDGPPVEAGIEGAPG